MDFQVAVVKDIVLDNTSKYFSNVGEYNGIGSIYFEVVKGNYKSKGFAKPYFSNISNYPLLEELVYIFSLPSPDIQNNNYKKVFYYITPINTWNSNHHNGIPNIFKNTEVPESQQRDYTQTEAGAVRRVQDGSTDIVLGKTFKEKSNIKPLRKFEGDFILEGRLGNSIRFGSTVLLDDKPITPWSTGSNNGDPIVLIRNGQGDKGSVGYLPTLEDINLDPSSIYLTTTQKIPLTVSSNNYFSYPSDAPTDPNQYTGNQVILNSGRLVFNTTQDHLLLSSAKSISLSSLSTLNVDASEVIMQTGKIYLGSKSAKEPLLLGDTTVALLNDLIDIVASLLRDSIIANAGGVPVVPFPNNSPLLLTRLQKIQAEINSIKSNYNFTV